MKKQSNREAPCQPDCGQASARIPVGRGRAGWGPGARRVGTGVPRPEAGAGEGAGRRRGRAGCSLGRALRSPAAAPHKARGPIPGLRHAAAWNPARSRRPSPPGAGGWVGLLRQPPARVPAAHCPGPALHRPGGTGREPSPALPPGLPWAKTRVTGVPEDGWALCSGGGVLNFSGSPRRCRPSTSECLMAVNKEGAIRAHGRGCTGAAVSKPGSLWTRMPKFLILRNWKLGGKNCGNALGQLLFFFF